MSRVYFRSILAAALVLGCPSAFATSRFPDPIAKSVSTAAAIRLCKEDGGQPSLPGLIGELGVNSGINVFALPPPPELMSGPIARTPEAVAANWIIATESLDAGKIKDLKLRPDEYEKLSEMRFHLVEYLRSLEKPPQDSPYVLATGSSQRLNSDLSRGALLEDFFAPVLGGDRTASIGLQCTPVAMKAPDAKDGPKPGDPRWLVRGKIDDLAVSRFQPGSTTDDSEAFKKVSEAKLSFIDNDVKGEETVAVEAAIGYGWQVTRNDALIGFLHFTQNSTETNSSTDDDDSKDVRALTPGILYRHTLAGSAGVGSLGATIAPTYDLAQDARIVRARLFLNDIIIRRQGKPSLCASEVPWGERAKPWIYLSCRLGLFTEYGHILEAGRNADFATPNDDSYTGLGATVGLAFALARPKSLSPFSLTAEYRYLHIFDSEFGDDPERFVLELAYKIPKSNLSIGLSRTFGENSETFQHEAFNKLSIGFKY